MPRLRTIKPGFLSNELLAECDPLARILFAGLWMYADREGRLEDRPKRIKVDCLPYDDCDVHALLDQLAARGFILRYGADGVRYIQITTFSTHQNPHYKEIDSTIPPPPESEPAVPRRANGRSSADHRPMIAGASADAIAIIRGISRVGRGEGGGGHGDLAMGHGDLAMGGGEPAMGHEPSVPFSQDAPAGTNPAREADRPIFEKTGAVLLADDAVVDEPRTLHEAMALELVDAIGRAPQTKGEKRTWDDQVEALLAAEPPVTLSEVGWLVRRYRERFNVPCTPKGITNNLGALRAKLPRRHPLPPDPDGPKVEVPAAWVQTWRPGSPDLAPDLPGAFDLAAAVAPPGTPPVAGPERGRFKLTDIPGARPEPMPAEEVTP